MFMMGLVVVAGIGFVLVPGFSIAGQGGAIWTTNETCANPAAQDDNEYAIGETVHVRGSNFDPNTTYYFQITGQPGNASADPNIVVASGPTTTDADGYFCVAAYVVASDDDGTYTVDVYDNDSYTGNKKNDNYHVDGVLCGNNDVEANESCDDGNTANGDGCSALCQTEYCGDGITNNTDEVCDEGQSNGSVCSPAYGNQCTYCSSECEEVTLTGDFCGDNQKNGNEQCDGTDGVGDHQVCSETCTLTNLPYCGDEVVNQQSEQCDWDSPQACTTQSGYAGTQTCNMDPQVDAQMCTWMSCEPTEYCGDGIKNGPEACDGTDGISDPANYSCTRTCDLQQLTGTLTICKDHADKSPLIWDMTVLGQSGLNDGETWGVTTDSETGCVTLEALAYGTYQISEEEVAGWEQVYPNQGSWGTQTVEINSENDDEVVSFTNQEIPTYEFTGFKWNDLNGNGVRDCEQLFSAALVNSEIPVNQCEPLLSGWTIFIDENGNGVFDNGEMSTVTGENGWYEFSELSAGAYRVCEVQQNGWEQTSPTNAISNPNNCHVVTLPEGSEQDSCNFKYYDGDYLYRHDTCNFGNKEIPPQPVITLTKTDSPDPVVPGANITYTMAWTVANANVTNLVLTDVIPANTTFVSASAPGVYDAVSNTVTWNIGAAAIGNYSATLVVKVNSPLTNGTKINNTATIDSAETTPIAAVAQTTVTSGPVLVVEKTVDTATVNPGQTVNYTVKVTNTGNDTAVNVVMTDTLPSGFLTPDGLATVTHSFGNIAAGASATTTFPVVVPTTAAAGEVTNIVRINADNYTEISAQVALNVIVPVVLGEQIEETPVPQVLGESTELPVTGSNGLTWMLAGMLVATLVGLAVYLKPVEVEIGKSKSVK